MTKDNYIKSIYYQLANFGADAPTLSHMDRWLKDNTPDSFQVNE